MNNEISKAQDLSLGDTEKAYEGRFSIKIVDYDDDPNGKEVMFWEKKNLIVNLARKTLAHAIGDLDGRGTINQFRIGGKNDLTAAEMLQPPSPAVGDNDLIFSENVFVRNRDDFVDDDPLYPAFIVSYPDEPNETSVLFTLKIGRSEGNNANPATPQCFVCAGLFATNSAGLFASQSFPIIAKTPSRAIEISWQILF
jgi:hypothetical protein